MQMIDGMLLTDSISSLQSQVDARKADLKRLSEELQHSERELQLLIELARLRGIPVEASLAGNAERPTSVSEPAIDGHDNQLQEAVIQILRGSGTPMHIQDLLARVREAGVEVPGRGTSANLIASISSNPAIVRPVRGMYGLREWGLTDRPTLEKRRAARRRTSPCACLRE